MQSFRMFCAHLGEKLRKLLIEKGSFKEVELHLAKYKSRVEKEGRTGRWVTRAFLMERHGYTKLLACSLTSHRMPVLLNMQNTRSRIYCT